MKKPRVLVVDDDQAGAEAIKRALVELGCEVQTAASVPEGMLRLGRFRIDLVTTCVLLPGIGGLEFVKMLNENKGEMLYAVPVVVITACAGREYEEQARALGVEDYIRKPFQPEDLKARIRRALEKQGFEFGQGG